MTFFSKSRLLYAICSVFVPNHKCFKSYETFFVLQFLGRTTTSELESQGCHDTSGTVKFLRMIYRVFDCLNVSHFNQNTKGKPECKEYRDVNHWHFEVLIYSMLIILVCYWIFDTLLQKQYVL